MSTWGDYMYVHLYTFDLYAGLEETEIDKTQELKKKRFICRFLLLFSFFPSWSAVRARPPGTALTSLQLQPGMGCSPRNKMCLEPNATIILIICIRVKARTPNNSRILNQFIRMHMVLSGLIFLWCRVKKLELKFISSDQPKRGPQEIRYLQRSMFWTCPGHLPYTTKIPIRIKTYTSV